MSDEQMFACGCLATTCSQPATQEDGLCDVCRRGLDHFHIRFGDDENASWLPLPGVIVGLHNDA